MIRLICLLIGYLFGNIQTAYIYGRLHGIDIRTKGSGNAGTTNALRVLGRKAGIIVFVVDVLKMVVALSLVRSLIIPRHSDMAYLLAMYTAVGVVLGHNFPFYMGFKGGKGIATSAGLGIAFHIAFLPVGILTFFTVFLIFHYVSLGSILLYIAFFIQLLIMGQMGVFNLEPPLLYELYALGGFLTALAIIRHRANIGRLLSGTESKTYLSKKKREEMKKAQNEAVNK